MRRDIFYVYSGATVHRFLFSYILTTKNEFVKSRSHASFLLGGEDEVIQGTDKRMGENP